MKIVAALPKRLRRLARPLLVLAVAFGAPVVLYAVGAWVLTTLGTPGRSAGNPLGITTGQKYGIEGWTIDPGWKLDGAAGTTSARSAAFGANPFLMLTDNANNPNGSLGQFGIGTLTVSGAGSVEIGPTGGVREPNTLEIGPLLAVPEPGSATLAVLGGLGLLLLRHRKSGVV